MFSFKSVIVLLVAVASVCSAWTSMTLTYFDDRHGANCTVPTGAKSTYTLNVCQGTSLFREQGTTQVFQYQYEDCGTCKVPCHDGNKSQCQWGLYLPYYLGTCQSGISSVDQYGVRTQGYAFISTGNK